MGFFSSWGARTASGHTNKGCLGSTSPATYMKTSSAGELYGEKTPAEKGAWTAWAEGHHGKREGLAGDRRLRHGVQNVLQAEHWMWARKPKEAVGVRTGCVKLAVCATGPEGQKGTPCGLLSLRQRSKKALCHCSQSSGLPVLIGRSWHALVNPCISLTAQPGARSLRGSASGCWEGQDAGTWQLLALLPGGPSHCVFPEHT